MKYRILMLMAVQWCVFGGPLQTTSAQIVSWTDSFLLRTAGGFENPLLRVSFNPQPEPPIGMLPPELDLSEPTMPRITVPDSSYSDGAMRILFAVEEGFEIVAEGKPDNEAFNFEILGSGPSQVSFNIMSESGGVAAPGTWVAFNPQPEPPALGEGAGSIAFDFSFTSNSPATLAFQILSDGVEPLSFSQVFAADFNSDGKVDQQDLKQWRQAYAGFSVADADGDGDSDGVDYLIWQREFGGGMLAGVLGDAPPATDSIKTGGSPGAGSPVPEPSAVVLVGCFAGLWLRRAV